MTFSSILIVPLLLREMSLPSGTPACQAPLSGCLEKDADAQESEDAPQGGSAS